MNKNLMKAITVVGLTNFVVSSILLTVNVVLAWFSSNHSITLYFNAYNELLFEIIYIPLGMICGFITLYWMVTGKIYVTPKKELKKI